MAKFDTPLQFEDDGGFPFVLTAPLVYETDLAERIITVPVGFKTDLASIPRLVQPLLPKVGHWDRAAVIHDWLYATQPFSRGTCDAILREAMEVDGVGGRDRWLIYTGVRIGGWVAWRSDRPA